MSNLTLTPDEIGQLARDWFFKVIGSWEQRQAQLPPGGAVCDTAIPGVNHPGDPSHVADAKKDKFFLEQAQRALAENNLSPTQSIAPAVLKGAGVELPEDSPEYAQLCRALLRAQVEYFRCVSAWRMGDYSVTPADPLFQAPATPQTTPAPQAKAEPEDPRASSMPLSELVEVFIQTKIRDGEWNPTTVKNNPRKLRLFAETLGNKPFDLVTRDDIRDWRGVLTDLELSPGTIRLDFKVIASMFNWARMEGKVTIENPLKGLAPKDEKHTRDAFTPSDLKVLFHAPLYTGHWRVDRRDRPGTVLVKDHKYWLPLVALHSGLRVEEAAKLTLGDMREVEGVWCFSVTDAKTKAGNRIVPVHPRLIQLGLLEHRSKVEADSGKQLWPELRKGSEGRYSQGFVQWWPGFMKLIGLNRDGLVFHSFRHTFISTLLNAGVAHTTVQQLAGHALPGVTGGTYGGKLLTPSDRLEAFRELDFGVDLTHLMPATSS